MSNDNDSNTFVKAADVEIETEPERSYQKVHVLKSNWDLLRRAVVHIQRNGKPGYTLGDAADQAIEIFAAKVEEKFGPLPEGDVQLRRGRRVSLD